MKAEEGKKQTIGAEVAATGPSTFDWLSQQQTKSSSTWKEEAKKA